jgi:hypothetical protein
MSRSAPITLIALIALLLSAPYAHAEVLAQTMTQPPSDEEHSEHHGDLDNRADLLGVEQDFFRGATNFIDPGYRDMPNPVQMQLQPRPETDPRRASTAHP